MRRERLNAPVSVILNYLGVADHGLEAGNGWQDFLRCLPAIFSIILGRVVFLFNDRESFALKQGVRKDKSL